MPHSYNKEDVLDDSPGYYKGLARYKKTFYAPADWKSKTRYLYLKA